MQREVRFLHFTGTGKMITLVDCEKLCVVNVIPRATTKNFQRYKLKNTMYKYKPNGINFKSCSFITVIINIRWQITEY